MNTLSRNTKTRLFLAISVLLVGFTSCKKTDMIDLPSHVDVTKLTALSDSCSYTLDGISYIHYQAYEAGRRNAGANLDTMNGDWKWDSDTLQYVASYSIGSPGVNAGSGGGLKVSFVKKFAKSQLTRIMFPGIVGPLSDTLLYYPKGEQKYAVDYDRFNSQNGVTLEIITGNIGGVKSVLRTYSTEMVHFPTTINTDSQKNSKFEITNVHFFPANGGWLDSHILEAKFSAVLFDKDEKPYRLENGYLRIHID